ncbi:hypothetical protein HYH03_010277 [Edaphochlamys debaryana]|uniref:EGF-like domain-containing protein n=1 Tax=Edaphochlamys debaryana TaxID=47281 RepID=A0A835Y2B2_9CHLO|nr:hypothetical protein HYH03_010277 [Edaphochlamys debaryana]|eukprot:KAG2491270.1 hypothetical protein HYH03_010277 [Edaphochlamys debaryana]
MFDEIQTDHLRSSCEGSDGKGCKRKLCSLARGNWCKDYYAQQPIAWKPAPRGDKECQSTKYGMCNGVGVCQYDIGYCFCPAGWTGKDCGTRDLRPCTHRFRRPELEKGNMTPVSHVGPDGLDLDWLEPGWTASRCGGWCDQDLGACFCPPNTTFGVQPAPPGSPPGTPPVKRGRPIADGCKPNADPSRGNAKVEWGHTDPALMFGPDGWCNSPNPRAHCGCPIDGWGGHLCDVPHEAFCYNQCSGRGECITGWCKCHEGWYGYDCSRQRKSAPKPESPPMHESGERPWLASATITPPAAADPPPQSTRRRPLIYVYDTDPVYNTRLIQYRLTKLACVYRTFDPHNSSALNNYVYSLESYFIEQLSVSQHRTYDPEEADFFFVPVQVTCYLWPVLGWADHPWFGQPAAHSRSHQGSRMYLNAKRNVEELYPFWGRRGGADHIFMMLNDEGGCWMPEEVYRNSIILSHWGRMDEIHASGTAWGYDNYTHALDPWPPYNTEPTNQIYKGHPCYTPGKDLIVPSLKPASHFANSPIVGHPPMERDILLYLRGDTGPYRAWWYSRGIRQRIAKLVYKYDWDKKYRIFVGESWQISGGYSEHLARSLFCLVVPGDGWSARAEDAILHGCIPLVIMDGVHAAFESIIEWDAFALRVREEAVNEDLPKFLLSFSREQLERMQRRLATVWHRFAYAQGNLLSSELAQTYAGNAKRRDEAGRAMASFPGAVAEAKAQRQRLSSLGYTSSRGAAADNIATGAAPDGHPYQPLNRFPARSDAWNTIMAWLHSRIPHTRGPATPKA